MESIPRVKACAIGTVSVGKTSLIRSILNFDFNSSEAPTLGMGVFKAQISVASRTIAIDLYDTAGDERQRSVIPVFFRFANLFLAVFDLTDASTLAELEFFVQMASDVEPRALVYVVGNKSDLATARQVLREDGERYATQIGAQAYFETSAKTRDGVEELFEHIAANPTLEFQEAEGPITLDRPPRPARKSGCCQ
jgi:small GTP-binding protein